MKIAILGARGLIGKKILDVIESRWKDVPDVTVIPFTRLENESLSFGSTIIYSRTLDFFNPKEFDLVFSALNNKEVLLVLPKIKEANVFFVDKSTALRMHSDVPLVVPEVNLSTIGKSKIVASPNCVAIVLAIFIDAFKKYEVKHMNINTYQSVSGAGTRALHEFFKEVKNYALSNNMKGLFYEQPMAFNVLPTIGECDDAGNSEEETKVFQELHKIVQFDFPFSITCMRVGVTISHLISIHFAMKDITKEQMIKVLEKNGMVYSTKMLTPLNAAHEDSIFAFRLREHGDNNFSICLVYDNLRKGGALNAVQIAEKMLNFS